MSLVRKLARQIATLFSTATDFSATLPPGPYTFVAGPTPARRLR